VRPLVLSKLKFACDAGTVTVSLIADAMRQPFYISQKSLMINCPSSDALLNCFQNQSVSLLPDVIDNIGTSFGTDISTYGFTSELFWQQIFPKNQYLQIWSFCQVSMRHQAFVIPWVLRWRYDLFGQQGMKHFVHTHERSTISKFHVADVCPFDIIFKIYGLAIFFAVWL